MGRGGEKGKRASQRGKKETSGSLDFKAESRPAMYVVLYATENKVCSISVTNVTRGFLATEMWIVFVSIQRAMMNRMEFHAAFSQNNRG